jgi:predicted esterase
MKRAALFFTLLAAAASADPQLRPGTEVRWEAPGTEFGYVTVQLPTDRTTKPPVLFYFHGTGGRPRVFGRPLPKEIAERYVTVGMSYAKVPADTAMIDRGRACWSVCRSIRSRIAAVAPINTEQSYVTGFSRGGWISNAIADARPKDLGGAAILGAGKSPMHAGLNGKVTRPLAVLVGIGEFDVNFGPSQEAVSYFNGIGATVTYAEFAGVGHSLTFTPRFLSWFAIQTATASEKRTMAAEIKDELRAAFKLASPAERYLAASDLAGDPRFALMSTADQERIQAARAKLRRSPVLRQFNAERDLFRKTVKAEVVAYGNYGGRAADLRGTLAGFKTLYRESPNSPYAPRAMASAVRLSNVWLHILTEYPHFGNPKYEQARNAYHKLFSKAKNSGSQLEPTDFAQLQTLQKELDEWGRTQRGGPATVLIPADELQRLQRQVKAERRTTTYRLRSGLSL